MFALCSLVDGGLMRIDLCGHIMSPTFVTMEEAVMFCDQYEIVCRIEFVRMVP